MAGVPKPSDSVLLQLASLVVHVEEGQSKDGHAFDHAAAAGIIGNPEVQAWIKKFPPVLLPRKRSA